MIQPSRLSCSRSQLRIGCGLPSAAVQPACLAAWQHVRNSRPIGGALLHLRLFCTSRPDRHALPQVQLDDHQRAADAARLDQAARLNTWEEMKRHVFVDAFARAARAYDACFVGGGEAIAGLDSFVRDLEQTRDSGLARQVRLLRPAVGCGQAMLWPDKIVVKQDERSSVDSASFMTNLSGHSMAH
jgi:hypothetical protein